MPDRSNGPDRNFVGVFLTLGLGAVAIWGLTRPPTPPDMPLGIVAVGPPVFTVRGVEVASPSQISVTAGEGIGVRWAAHNTSQETRSTKMLLVVARNGTIYVHSGILEVLPGATLEIMEDFFEIYITLGTWRPGDNVAELQLFDLREIPEKMVANFTFTLTVI